MDFLAKWPKGEHLYKTVDRLASLRYSDANKSVRHSSLDIIVATYQNVYNLLFICIYLVYAHIHPLTNFTIL